MALSHVFHTGTFLLLCATALFLVATISSPIIHNVGFLKVTSDAGTVYFGTLGYCIKNAGASKASECSHAHVGYDIAGVISAATGTAYSNAALDSVTRALILQAVVTALAFIALLIAAGASCCGFIFASFIAGIAWLLAFVTIVIDFSLFGAAKDHINSSTGAHATFGIAIWLALSGFLVLFFASIMTCFACFTDRRSSTRKHRW